METAWRKQATIYSRIRWQSWLEWRGNVRYGAMGMGGFCNVASNVSEFIVQMAMGAPELAQSIQIH
jgi:hypothetical protein